jgi:glycosyltransferase involved in cell wall biosynthesis
MTQTALLGFGIPTYRRPQLLDLALQSIVPQAQLTAAPIYISDNSCDQTNVAVIRKWQGVYPHILHEINEDNLGIDRNVDRAIVRCPAEYVHVIGDDDVIFPGFATQVLAAIAAGAPNHIVCSYMYLANDYRPITGGAVIPPEGPATPMRALLPNYGWALGFIGAHVFRRERFAACAIDGFGSYFHHLIRLINYIDPDERLGFVPTPLVGNRADDESTPTWSASRLTVVFGLEKALANAMQDRYSPAEIERSISRARTVFGYARFGRLLYTAALAEQSGHAAQYWEALAQLVPPSRYRALRGVPRFVYRPLLQLMSLGRRTKRQVQSLVRDNAR